ncbi:MAG: RNA polymerase sigma factor [Fidelibacterota bacterium]
MADDELMLSSLRAGSAEAFRQLFEMYSDRMFRLALGILGDEQEAEDVAQDAFLRFFEKLDQFKGLSRVGTWLYRVVHNLSVDRLRHRKPIVHLSEAGTKQDGVLTVPAIFVDWSTAPELLLDRSETQSQLDKAITGLPVPLRTVFILRDIEELSTGETAEILNITPGAVKVRLHRARLLLREHLAAYFAEMV